MKEAPRRFWRVTLWTPEGRELRRDITCPYLVPDEGQTYRRPLAPGDDDYPDTHAAMTAALGSLQEDRVIEAYRVSPTKPERISKVRDHAVRWTTVRDELSVDAVISP